MALLSPLITHTVVAAGVGANLNLSLALESNKASGAEAVTLTALTAIGGTILITCLISTRIALPSNLAKARGFIATVTVLTVRADGLGAIHTTISNVTLALARHTIATTVPRAAIGAHLLLTRLTHES